MTEMADERWVSGFRHAHLRSSWIHYQINQKDGVNSPPPPFSPPNFHKESRTIPGVLFIVVILAFLFLVSGLVYLLVRFLTRNSSSSIQNFEPSNSDAIEGQLQQLFHLDDSGLDQAFIDSLPVFSYKEIVGTEKEPFDCAVCLCEFSERDELRLIPICGHAFHIKCIDTWLLSNSTCPLCRGALFSPEFSFENPVFDYDYLWEEDRDNAFASVQKKVENEQVEIQKGVIPVRLGKFQKLNNVEKDVGETSSSNLDCRRCYSMGSYQYIVGNSNLRVALHDGKVMNGNEQASVEGKKICAGGKTDSYSVSKIWLWSKRGNFTSSSNSLNLLRIDRT